MNADFIRIAHRKAVWAELRRVLLERYVAEDAPPKEQIICEEVPYKSKEVTNEAILECLDEIQQLELDEQMEMSKFEMRKRPERVRRQPAEQQPEQPEPSDGKPVERAAPVPVPTDQRTGFDYDPNGSPEPRDEEDGEEDGGDDASAAPHTEQVAPPEGEQRRKRAEKAG
jgi:hypothetical protein